jgi:hypothetical protein
MNKCTLRNNVMAGLVLLSLIFYSVMHIYRRGLPIPTNFSLRSITCHAHIRHDHLCPTWKLHSGTCKDEVRNPLRYLRPGIEEFAQMKVQLATK